MDTAREGEWPPGAASRWWLHHSLKALAAAIAVRGSRLLVFGDPEKGALQWLRELMHDTGADGVCWNRRYEPAALARDAEVKAALRGAGVWVESFNAALLEEPWEVRNKAGRPFQVFTPYWRRALQVLAPPPPLDMPQRLASRNFCSSRQTMRAIPSMRWRCCHRSGGTAGSKTPGIG